MVSCTGHYSVCGVLYGTFQCLNGVLYGTFQCLNGVLYGTFQCLWCPAWDIPVTMVSCTGHSSDCGVLYKTFQCLWCPVRDIPTFQCLLYPVRDISVSFGVSRDSGVYGDGGVSLGDSGKSVVSVKDSRVYVVCTDNSRAAGGSDDQSKGRIHYYEDYHDDNMITILLRYKYT